MKRLLLPLLLCIGCSTDPLDKRFTEADRFDPLYDEDGNPVIDRLTIRYIRAGALMDDLNDVSSEGKTFRELYEQGHAQEVIRRTRQIQDKAMRNFDSTRKVNGLKPLF